VEPKGQQQGNVVALPPRRAGRPLGSRNKVTREVRELAQRYTRRALRAAWKLAQEAAEEEVRLKAIALVLAYGHGRPIQAQWLTCKDGAPLVPQPRAFTREDAEATAKAVAVMIAEAAGKSQ
jgi:hypothetical protein